MKRIFVSAALATLMVSAHADSTDRWFSTDMEWYEHPCGLRAFAKYGEDDTPAVRQATSSARKTRSSAPSCFRNYITLASTSAAMRYTPSTSISADSGTRTGIHRTNDRSLSCFMTGTVLRTRVQPFI